MSVAVASAVTPRSPRGRSIFRNPILRAIIALATFVVLWELGSRLKLRWIGDVPAPSVVLKAWIPLLTDQGYWYSWYQSSRRV
ncbi:MAG: hypothetical protein ACM3X5_04290, partial [Bacillota bacterium]